MTVSHQKAVATDPVRRIAQLAGCGGAGAAGAAAGTLVRMTLEL